MQPISPAPLLMAADARPALSGAQGCRGQNRGLDINDTSTHHLFEDHLRQPDSIRDDCQAQAMAG
jgi:hypothetical protein